VIPLLKDPETIPTDEVLEKEFGALFPTYHEFMETVKSDEFRLTPEWRYYKDGKAWLCKLCLKKKTVVWLSAWPGSFKLAFYFTEKSGAGIQSLSVKDSLKKSYEAHKPIGKLKPLVIEVKNKSQLKDIYTLIKYKSGIK